MATKYETTNEPLTAAQPISSGPAAAWPTGSEDPAVQALAAAAHLDPADPVRLAAREQLVRNYLPFARRLASRFANRGESLDDLVQVATVGLLRAADRFDAQHGSSFAGFAGPTILGELRHHFRDRTWVVRVSRHLQEVHLEARSVATELAQQLGREPTEAEIAGRMRVDPAEVRAGMAAGTAYRADSINAPATADADGAELGDLLGAEDGEIESFADRYSLALLVAELSEADRSLLRLRFVDELSQSQIAELVGVSQMQVSRLLKAVLGRLRAALMAEEPVS